MRHFYFTLFAFLCACSTIAQVNNPYLLIAESNVYAQGYEDSITYAYDNQNRLSETNTWSTYFVPSLTLTYRSIDFTYDSNDSLKGVLSQKLNSNWEDSYRKTMTLDDEGKMLSRLEELWEDTVWTLYKTESWEYYPNDKLKSHTTSYTRQLYVYDTLGRLSRIIQQQKNGAGAWAPDEIREYTYTNDTEPNPSQILLKRWFGTSLYVHSRALYTYEPNGNLSTVLFEDYNSSNDTWEKSYRSLYFYNLNNQRTQWVFQIYYSGQWHNNSRISYTYNGLQLLESIVDEYVGQNGTWDPSRTRRFYYAQALPTQLPSTPAPKCYPNPADQIVTIQGDNWIEAAIIDPLGRLLRSVQVNGETDPQIDVRDITPGTCFLRLTDKAGRTAAQKLEIAH